MSGIMGAWQIQDGTGCSRRCSTGAGLGPATQEWLQAMLDAEAALARALESAGQAPAGAGAAVTAAARAADFDAGRDRPPGGARPATRCPRWSGP